MSAPDDSAPLRRLVAEAMAPRRPSVWDAPPEPLRQQAALLYLLLDRGPPDDAAAFLVEQLPHLVRELRRSSAARVVADQRGVRGRVLWAATVAARAERGDGGPTFAYREVRHQYDTPENQLVRFVVELLHAGLQRLGPAARSALCYRRAAGALERSPAAERLAAVEAALQQARASAGLRSATLPARVEPGHLVRAEMARNEAYAVVGRIYRRYAALAGAESWRAALAQVARRTLVLPAAEGAEGEPLVELAAIALRGA